MTHSRPLLLIWNVDTSPTPHWQSKNSGTSGVWRSRYIILHLLDCAVCIAPHAKGVDDDGDAPTLLVGHFFDREEGGGAVDVALVVSPQVAHLLLHCQRSFRSA